MLFILSALLSTALANPVIPQDVMAPVPQISASYLYAVDFAQVASTSSLTCLKQNGYSVVFVRGYTPAGQGTFDTNACTNIQNAYSAGVGTEVYMTPQPSSSKAGYTQLDEMYNGLRNKGITVRGVWIQVTSPVNWSSSPSTNVNFISSILTRARYYGLSVGVYTSVYDWNQITNAWTGAGSDVMLWYWNVYGGGSTGESSPDFSDFRPFGSWNAPTVKQFGQQEPLCSINPLNKDVFTNSNLRLEGMAKFEKEAGPVAGGNIRM